MVRRVLAVKLDGWLDPEEVFSALFADDDYSFWLDSGATATGGMSYLGSASANSRIAEASVADANVRVSGTRVGDAVSEYPGTIFDFLRLTEAWPRGRGARPGVAAEPGSSAPLGWIGWIGYEAGAGRLGVPARSTETPDAALLWVDRLIAFDHATREVSFVGWDTGETKDWANRTTRALRARTAPRVDDRLGPDEPDRRATWRHDDQAYLEMIETCQSAIYAGDAYQICLTNQVRVEPGCDPLSTYLRLRRLNGSHHGGLLRFGEFSLLSSSPERFLDVDRSGNATTRPIKGTRRRGETPEADDALRAELVGDEKERAENVMIVDLMRNDLSRVCKPGSVAVERLLEVETYPRLHQLVSSVTGSLAPGLTAVDALEACFPAGSMTGAPKLSAMHILFELENGPRGIYAGCFGFLAADGRADLAMVIRSIVAGPDCAWVGAGGGITALSDPAAELEETKLKAAVLLEALSVRG